MYEPSQILVNRHDCVFGILLAKNVNFITSTSKS